MKIVKRDGRIVEYNSDKIRLAISKANSEVEEEEQASEKEIEDIIKYIEKSKKKRMLVEDIQDIIEQKLMELKRYELAKAYIIYRYTRALVRKSNTTDETILSLIKGSNLESMESYGKKYIVSMQRDLIAGEVSKDLTRRMLLPEKISKAHDMGIIFFHNMEYFLQPVINSSNINIKDILDNGTVINETKIDTPNSFKVACIVVSQIISAVISAQSGECIIDISCLGKYLNKSYIKLKEKLEEKYNNISKKIMEEIIQDMLNEELKAGIQTLNYQINTLTTTNGKDPKVTFILNLEENEYIEENASIYKEMLNQRIDGMKDERDNFKMQVMPKIIYILNENTAKNNSKFFDVTKLAMDCAIKLNTPSFVTGYEYLAGTFNQGTVTLNLANLALYVKTSKEDLWQVLDSRLDLCFEALMCRHHALLGTLADTSPIHFKYGGAARLKEQEKIDTLLKSNKSTLTLGYVGMEELTKILDMDVQSRILKKIKEICDRWKKETGLKFLIRNTENEASKYFVKKDRENYGIIKGITDKSEYLVKYNTNNEEELKQALQESAKLEKYGDRTTLVLTDFIKNNIEQVIHEIYNTNKFVEFRKED